MPLTKLQKEMLRGRAIQLSKHLRALSVEILAAEGIKILEEYSLVIDELLLLGFEGDNREDVLQVMSAHSEMISVVEKIADQLSVQHREVLLRMRGILRYLDALPASISVSSSKKG